MKIFHWSVLCCLLAANSLSAGDPGPTQPAGAVNPPFHGAGLNQPFPDNYYGADHGGSSLNLSYPFTSRFGNTDHSRGVITYYCAPFTPRNSEGVYGMDVWLEASTDGGGWSVAGANNGLADGAGSAYQPVNTPNPGPSPAYRFQWTFDDTPLPPQTSFRVFVYVYLYNQGGGSQGNFYVASSLGTVSSGAANDAPSITWDASYGAVNPASVLAGQTYSISATATDDNGNLTSVQLFRNGQPWVAGNGGDGESSTAAGSSTDSSGVITYSAQATDSDGQTSPLIAYSVSILALQSQPAVGSADASLNLGQAFAPVEFGGAGAGGWQFAVGGSTNFNAGATDDTGTNLPGSGWVPTWTAPAAGSYSFWVSRNGDGTYLPSAIAGPYTLTVIDPTSASSAPPSSPDPVDSAAPPVVTTTTPTNSSPASSTPASPSDPGDLSLPSSSTPSSPVTSGSPGTTSSTPAPSLSTSSGGSVLVFFTQPVTLPSAPAPIKLPPLTDNTPASTPDPTSTSTPSTPSSSDPITAADPTPTPDPTPSSTPTPTATSAPTPASTPAPSQTSTQTPAPPPIEIARIRFNSNGQDAAVHAKSNRGSSILWTDPIGLATSAWPNFSPASAAAVSTGNFPLPAPGK